MKSWVKVAVGFSGALLLLIFALSFLIQKIPGSSSTKQLSLQFLFFTNRVPKWMQQGSGDYAVFCLSNPSPKTILCYAESIEVWTNELWQVNILRCTPNWPGFGSIIGPAKTNLFFVPAPGKIPWRIRLHCTERARGFKGIKQKIEVFLHNMKNAARGDSTRIDCFGGTNYEIVSPELNR